MLFYGFRNCEFLHDTKLVFDKASINGRLNENYVYINLAKRLDFPQQIAFETPAFATYKNGEIDLRTKSERADTVCY